MTSLHQGGLGVQANVQHFAIALRVFAEAKEVDRGKAVFALVVSNPEISQDPHVLNAIC